MTTLLERIRARNLAGQAPAPKVTTTSSKPAKSLRMNAQEALKVFGHEAFREGQEDIINAVVDGTGGVLAVFPTGYGKSLVYQLPSLMSNNLTVVVSPLIALMKDQVDKLQSLGVNAILINSTLTDKETTIALAEVSSGGITALYVAPERFRNKQFVSAIKNMDIDILAIDEAHCISRWGHDFRPAYTDLGGAVEMLNPRMVVALTATATKKVQDDICQVLNMEGAKRFVSSPYRSNLQLAVAHQSGYGRMQCITEVVKDFQAEGSNTGIIYATTRNEAEEICDYLKNRNVPAMFYHAGLKPAIREEVQNKWAQDGGVIVATCAFGMGIDKPDVRFVIHSGLSPSIEDWYQAIGRAGRDGKESLCLTVCDFKDDYRTQMFLIDMTNPSGDDVNTFWGWLSGVARGQVSPGEETTEVKMTQKVMKEESGCLNVGACISVLKRSGLVETIGRGRYKVNLKDVTIETDALTAARNDKIAKLKQVCSFYRMAGCRFKYVCDYFGDETFPGSCGHCDNCS
jgi:ATP-dependent DNA helicase RecQ